MLAGQPGQDRRASQPGPPIDLNTMADLFLQRNMPSARPPPSCSTCSRTTRPSRRQAADQGLSSASLNPKRLPNYAIPNPVYMLAAEGGLRQGAAAAQGALLRLPTVMALGLDNRVLRQFCAQLS